MGQMQTIGRGHTKVTTCLDGTTKVRYHDTDVVIFDTETITLQTGGWLTATTKARMNQTANQYDLGFIVYQKNFAWYVHTDAGNFPLYGVPLTLDRATMEPVTLENLQESSR